MSIASNSTRWPAGSMPRNGAPVSVPVQVQLPGRRAGPALDAVSLPLAGGESGMDLYIQQDRFREVFAADVAPEVAELMAATQRPIAATALEDIATKAAWKSIPSWTLVTTQDRPSRPTPCASWPPGPARRPSRSTPPTPSPCHNPASVADLIDTAARATADVALIGAAGHTTAR